MTKRKAFTLIELLVVIAIIGILSGLIVLAMNGSTNKARVARAQVYSNSLRTALMSNVLGDWPLDGSPNDLWTHTTGTANGSPATATDCAQNTCYTLASASSQYVSTPNTTGSYTIGANGMTAMIWVKGASQTNKVFFANYDNTAANKGAWKIYSNASNGALLDVKLADSTTQGNFKDYFSTSDIALDNTWHLVGFTWTIGGASGVLSLYIDGNSVAVTKTNGDAQVNTLNASGSTTAPITIGNDYTGGSVTAGTYFNGSVDNARLYNATIPTSQIKELYYAGLNNLLASGKISADEYSQRISTLSLNK